MNILILFAILIPLIAGCAIPLLKIQNRKSKNIFMAAVLAAEAVCCVYIAVTGCEKFTLWEMTGSLAVSFAADELTQLFIVFTSILWALVGIFAFEYMKHEQSEDRFYAFFLVRRQQNSLKFFCVRLNKSVRGRETRWLIIGKTRPRLPHPIGKQSEPGVERYGKNERGMKCKMLRPSFPLCVVS